jgi:hypothetical protein
VIATLEALMDGTETPVGGASVAVAAVVIPVPVACQYAVAAVASKRVDRTRATHTSNPGQKSAETVSAPPGTHDGFRGSWGCLRLTSGTLLTGPQWDGGCIPTTRLGIKAAGFKRSVSSGPLQLAAKYSGTKTP